MLCWGRFQNISNRMSKKRKTEFKMVSTSDIMISPHLTVQKTHLKVNHQPGKLFQSTLKTLSLEICLRELGSLFHITT